MRLVVADTTPLNYLILIEQDESLARLFKKIFVPKPVLDELVHVDAPQSVREWATVLPSWVEVIAVASPRKDDPSLERLDEGERAAI